MAEFFLADADGVIAINSAAAAVESQLGDFGVTLDIARRQAAQALPDGIDVFGVLVLRPFVFQLKAEPDFKQFVLYVGVAFGFRVIVYGVQIALGPRRQLVGARQALELLASSI
jgi:hypothetical protein